MPRYHSDSESDYSPPRRRSPTPGPRRVRDMSPDHRPRFQYDGPTPFYPPTAPPMASGAAGPGPTKRATGGPATDRWAAEQTTIMPRRSRDRDRGRGPAPASDSHNRNTSPSHSRSRSRSRSRSPLAKARSLLASTFTPSTSGLGAGVLGAIVGGLAAAEVSEHHHSHGHGHGRGGDNHSRERERHRLLSTVVGAAVGGLGANAIEKRLEASSKERKETQGSGEGGRYREDDGRYNRNDGVGGKGSRERGGGGDWVRY